MDGAAAGLRIRSCSVPAQACASGLAQRQAKAASRALAKKPLLARAPPLRLQDVVKRELPGTPRLIGRQTPRGLGRPGHQTPRGLGCPQLAVAPRRERTCCRASPRVQVLLWIWGPILVVAAHPGRYCGHGRVFRLGTWTSLAMNWEAGGRLSTPPCFCCGCVAPACLPCASFSTWATAAKYVTELRTKHRVPKVTLSTCL